RSGSSSTPVTGAAMTTIRRLEDAVPRRDRRLAAAVVAAMAVLTVCTLAHAPRVAEAPIQLVLVVSFVLLAFSNFRLSVGIGIFELALAGAAGKWTVLPGDVSGRNV